MKQQSKPENVTRTALNRKPYDLEDRTREFAKRVRCFIKGLRKSIAAIEDSKQLIKASGSVGANYIEVCEALSEKDSILRIMICRKESKESRYWLRLIEVEDDDQGIERRSLEQEATELMNIFGSILRRKEKGL